MDKLADQVKQCRYLNNRFTSGSSNSREESQDKGNERVESCNS